MRKTRRKKEEEEAKNIKAVDCEKFMDKMECYKKHAHSCEEEEEGEEDLIIN